MFDPELYPSKVMKLTPLCKTVFAFLFLIGTITVTGCKNAPETTTEDDSSDKPKVAETTRKFDMRYAASIKGVPAGATVRVWFPIPQSNPQQDILDFKPKTPSPLKRHHEPTYGNLIGYFEIKQEGDAPVDWNCQYRIARHETGTDTSVRSLSDEKKGLFLAANKLVPISGRPMQLLSDKKLSKDPTEAGQQLYEIVEQYMTYDKSKPGYGNGDSVWACDSKTGNCTDFHSLFISLARSQKIPARFEIGFPLSEEKEGKIKGYHCWAWFFSDELGWIPTDISEADKHPEMKDYYFGNLTKDRVGFSTGRDIKLVPESASDPLNYFVYPHVEVDGKVWPKEKIELDFSFKDVN